MRYLDALVAKDPKRLPLSADVKYTEQEQVMAVGDGFWKTVTARGNYNHYFSDPVIENGLIRRVEMIGTSVPYHFNSTWGPFLSGK